MNHHLIPQLIRQELVVHYDLQVGAMASGGLSSAWIWQCQSPHGPLALRGWPAQHPTPQRLSQIHTAMHYAREQGLESIPAIFANRQGKTFTSDGQRLWELTQWMPGNADYHEIPSTQRLQSALQSLAKLHGIWQTTTAHYTRLNCSSTDDARESNLVGNLIPPSVGPSPAVADRRQKLEFSLQRGPAWRAEIGRSAVCHSSPANASLIVDAQVGELQTSATLSWLAQQTLMHLTALGPALLIELSEIQPKPVQLHFVLRDVWSDHILFTADQVTGIIDFGAARIDEPATDVSRLLGSLEPLDASRWLMGWQAYHAVLPHVELERVRVLDRAGTLLAAVQWLQWLVIEPRQFDVPLHQLLTRWQRLLRRLEASW